MVINCRRKTTAVIAALTFFALMVAPVRVAHAQQAPSPLSLPVVGTVLGGGTFAGTLSLTSFRNQSGQVVAVGTVTGMLTDSAGKITTVAQNVVAPVTIAQATCTILHLDLGPISLNLLGLHVDLSEVVLDITGETGAGNLLGNLLCGVAGLLDNPGGLARLLNQILAILG